MDHKTVIHWMSIPPVELDKECSTKPEAQMPASFDLVDELRHIAVSAMARSAYIETRANGHGHAEALKRFRAAYVAARRTAGFAYPSMGTPSF
jgi:hypothetical protein